MTHIIALADYRRQNVMQTMFRVLTNSYQIRRQHVHFPRQTRCLLRSLNLPQFWVWR